MWDKEYKDYKRDKPLKQQRIESGKGWAGCEMSERNGWGNSYQQVRKKRGWFFSWLTRKTHDIQDIHDLQDVQDKPPSSS